MLMHLLFYETLLHLDKPIDVKYPCIKKVLLRTSAHLFSPHSVDFCWAILLNSKTEIPPQQLP